MLARCLLNLVSLDIWKFWIFVRRNSLFMQLLVGIRCLRRQFVPLIVFSQSYFLFYFPEAFNLISGTIPTELGRDTSMKHLNFGTYPQCLCTYGRFSPTPIANSVSFITIIPNISINYRRESAFNDNSDGVRATPVFENS